MRSLSLLLACAVSVGGCGGSEIDDADDSDSFEEGLGCPAGVEVFEDANTDKPANGGSPSNRSVIFCASAALSYPDLTKVRQGLAPAKKDLWGNTYFPESWNDRISSFRVFGESGSSKLRVRFFDDANYHQPTNVSAPFWGYSSGFEGYSRSDQDRASSLEMYWERQCAAGVEVFEDAFTDQKDTKDHKNRSATFCAAIGLSYPDLTEVHRGLAPVKMDLLGNMYFPESWDDRISSFRVFGRTESSILKVTFFDDSDYGGHHPFGRDYASGEGFEGFDLFDQDRISSIKMRWVDAY